MFTIHTFLKVLNFNFDVEKHVFYFIQIPLADTLHIKSKDKRKSI